MSECRMMSGMKFSPLLALAALLVAAPLRADDICSGEQHQVANAGLARAQAAESAGDLLTALQRVDNPDVLGCGDYKAAEALLKRVTKKLGADLEAKGELEAAFNHFTRGGWFEDAQRVGLKQLASTPDDIKLASRLMSFMQNQGFNDGADKVRENARQQAQRLLAEEAKVFSERSPRIDLLQQASDWLQLAGDPVGPVNERALQRGDGYLALNYAYALEQALDYYGFAEREDKSAAVRDKARSLAEQLADGDNWASAVELYGVAGDTEKAEELEERRRADAAITEKERQEQFQKEQDDLEAELDL